MKFNIISAIGFALIIIGLVNFVYNLVLAVLRMAPVSSATISFMLLLIFGCIGTPLIFHTAFMPQKTAAKGAKAKKK